MTLRLDGRVAIVTGAGTGLGRAYALRLASLGASVVVNDLGGSLDGEGASTSAAQAVVDEIKSHGGQAVASPHSVSDPQAAAAIVQTAIDAFGGVDIVVNNAGILRDKSFAKMALSDYRAVIDVHLLGTVYVTHAAWPHLLARQWGRVVVTSSIAGLAGNFGQANYAAAKMGVLGFMNTLAIEGRKRNVLVNAISPSAATRMTTGLLSETLEGLLKPEHVAAGVAWLCSEACTESGLILAAGGGGFGRVALVETEGVQLDPNQEITVDMVAQQFTRWSELSTARALLPGGSSRTTERLKKGGYL